MAYQTRLFQMFAVGVLSLAVLFGANQTADQACGAYAINGLMVAARSRGLDVRLLDVRNSGDTAGDRYQVVGYGSFALTPRTAR